MLVESEFRDTEMRDGGRQEQLIGRGQGRRPWTPLSGGGGSVQRALPLVAVARACCCPAGVQAGMQVSVAPLVEVMQGETVTLDCTPLGDHNQYLLKWFLVSVSGWEPGVLEGDLKVRAQ